MWRLLGLGMGCGWGLLSRARRSAKFSARHFGWRESPPPLSQGPTSLARRVCATRDANRTCSEGLTLARRSNPLVSPVLKWVGGKRQLLPAILPKVPSSIGTYFEPFLGGGAVFFALQPPRAVVSDANEGLIELYCTIRDDVEGLIAELAQHRNTAEYFYAMRNWDRDPAEYALKSAAARSARMIYLNKTCFNGLFRVNNAGQFNTPFGHYDNPKILDEARLKAVSAYLRSAKVKLKAQDYFTAVQTAKSGDFVYLDPPYDPVSTTSNFTGYVQGGFGRKDQEKLRDVCMDLTRRDVKFMLSNSATDFILDIYSEFNVSIVSAKRNVNSHADGRGDVNEVLVTNYA